MTFLSYELKNDVAIVNALIANKDSIMETAKKAGLSELYVVPPSTEEEQAQLNIVFSTNSTAIGNIETVEEEIKTALNTVVGSEINISMQWEKMANLEKEIENSKCSLRHLKKNTSLNNQWDNAANKRMGDFLESEQNKIQKIENQEELQNTILDNLARLLEGSSVCTAICFSANKLFVTQNELGDASGSRDGQGYTLIENLIDYLKNQETKEGLEIFRDICRQKLSPIRFPGTINRGEDEIFNTITKDVFTRGSEWWRKLSAGKIIKKFSLVEKTSNPDGVATQINTTYQVFSRAAHDFRAVEVAFKTYDTLKNVSLQIIQDNDTRGVHAELRIINHLFREENLYGRIKNGEPQYIGISKLCCSKCRHTIKALNVIFQELQEKQSIRNHPQYLIRILSAAEKPTNQDRRHGKIIIRKHSEDEVEIVDYKQNKFIKVDDLQEPYRSTALKISKMTERDVINDIDGIELAEYLGCIKSIIGYADSSTRETHGVKAGEERWVRPPFMKQKLGYTTYLPFFNENKKERHTRNSIRELILKDTKISPEIIREKYKEIKEEYLQHLRGSQTKKNELNFQDQAATPSPPSTQVSPAISPKKVTTTAGNQIILDEITNFLTEDIGNICKVLEKIDQLNIKHYLLDKLNEMQETLQESLGSEEKIETEDFKKLMKELTKPIGVILNLEKETGENYMGVITKIKETVSEKEICTVGEFKEIFEESYMNNISLPANTTLPPF